MSLVAMEISRKLVYIMHALCTCVTTALYCWLKMLLCLCVLLVMVVSGQTAARQYCIIGAGPGGECVLLSVYCMYV